MSSQKKFLVIGSNGQIGTVLTNRLGEKYGFENVVGSDLRPPENQTKFIFEECSVLDKDRLDKIIGRETDILYTPKLKILIVHFFTGIFEHFPEIQQFQVIQRNKGGSIQIKYIKGVNFSKNIMEKIKNKIHQRAEEIFPIAFNEVREIKPSPSGKPQIIIREY